MIAILVGLIALGLLVVALMVLVHAYQDNINDGMVALCGVAGLPMVLFTGAALVVWCANAPSWFGAEHKAHIINETFGTHYTQAEVFWGEDVIDEVRELRRKRIELNGDLFSEEKP